MVNFVYNVSIETLMGNTTKDKIDGHVC